MMKQKFVKIIKKCLGLFHSVNFIWHLFFDPSTIKNKWYREIKRTQISEVKPLFLDRQNEIKEFFHVNNLYLLKYYLKYGFPNTDKFKEHYLLAFKDNTEENKLKKAYDSIPFDYTLRLMLNYERYSMITEYLDFIIIDSGKKLGEFEVLDYGCGVSDIGLFFASFGAKVTICDLDNSRFDFTLCRFKNRGFTPETIRIIDTEIYPELPESKFDLVIATEVFEHVRNPLELLKNITKAINKGGYLFDSMGGNFERDDRPHHLKEAFKIGNSNEFIEFYNKKYIHTFPTKNLNYLFKKRD